MASYCTVEEASTYLSERLNTDAWSTASAANKTKALAQATRIIDQLRYQGSRATTAQENQFPRDTDTTIPADIKNACAEIALALLDGVDPEREYENLRLQNQAYGAVRTNYSNNIHNMHIIAGVPSVTAWRLLLPYLDLDNEVSLYRVN